MGVVMHAEAADQVQVPLQVGRKRLQGDVDAGGAGLGADVSQLRGGGDEDAPASRGSSRPESCAAGRRGRHALPSGTSNSPASARGASDP